MKTKDLYLSIDELHALLLDVDMDTIKEKHLKSCREIYIPYQQFLYWSKLYTPVEKFDEFLSPADTMWLECSNSEYLMHLAIATVADDEGLVLTKYNYDNIPDEFFESFFVWRVMDLFGALQMFDDFNVNNRKDKNKWSEDYHNASVLYHYIKTKLVPFYWTLCQDCYAGYRMTTRYATRRYISAPDALGNYEKLRPNF